MKLRWTDGRTYAETFTANDEQSFVDNGTPALRVFRVATGRRVHRGEVHRIKGRPRNRTLALHSSRCCMSQVHPHRVVHGHHPSNGQSSVSKRSDRVAVYIAEHRTNSNTVSNCIHSTVYVLYMLSNVLLVTLIHREPNITKNICRFIDRRHIYNTHRILSPVTCLRGPVRFLSQGIEEKSVVW
jgi:hypothetical protein